MPASSSTTRTATASATAARGRSPTARCGSTPTPRRATRRTCSPPSRRDANGAYACANIPTTGSFTVEAATDAVRIASGTAGASYNTSGGYTYNETVDFALTTKSIIRGNVYADPNGNGTYESGEGTVGYGRRVYLDLDGDAAYDAGEPSALTGQFGDFQIGGLDAGNYTVRAAPITDYAQTGPAGNGGVAVAVGTAPTSTRVTFSFQYARAGAIGGRMFYDYDGDGVEDFDEGSNWTHGVQLIPQNLPGEPTQTAYVSDYNGSYSFSGLLAGTYVLRPYDLSGNTLTWTRTTPAGTGDVVVTLPQNQTVTAPKIGLTTAPLYPRYSGVAFDDTDGDGVQDSGELPRVGVTVYADQNGDGQYNAGAEYVSVTDSLGRWSVSTFTSDPVQLRQVVPAGRVQTTPLAGGAIAIDAPEKRRYENLAFGSRVGATGSISGTLYNDVNGSGTQDPGESVAVGTSVFLDADDDGVLDSTEAKTTVGSGGFTFSFLPFGTYHVRAVLPAGWVYSTSPLPDVTLSGAAPAATGLSIGMHNLGQSSTITGVAFDDANGDGVKGQFELGASYATLYIDLNQNGSLDAGEPNAKPFAGDGSFSLSAYNPGTVTHYSVRAIVGSAYDVRLPIGGAPLDVSVGLYQTVALGNRFAFTHVGPYATAGGGYAVAEGGSIPLSAAGSGPATGHTIAKYEWDLNYDGKTFDVDATGIAATFAAPADVTGAIAAAGALVAVRVTDEAGRYDIDSEAVQLSNAAPTATLAATAAGLAATATFSAATDASAADRAAGYKYSFDFNNDGDFADAGDVANASSSSASYTFAKAGTYSIRGRIADKDGGYTDYTTTATVVAPATPPPPANVGWDQLAVPTEGATIQLIGNASPLAAGQTIAKWEWDYDYDGATFTLDASGKQPSIALPDGGSTRQVALRVTDNYGQVVTKVQTLTIANVAPVAAFTGNGGPSTATVYFDAIYDPSNADVAAGFTFSFDFNNDGDFADPGDIAYTRSAGASSPAYGTPGTHAIRGRVTDKDGGFTDYVRNVTITGATAPPGASNVGFTTANLFEGYDATLLGYATGLAAGQSIVKWEYDFNYDGKTFDVDAGVQQPTIRGGTLDGPSTRTIAVRVTDNYGQTTTRSQSLPIYNMGPDGAFTVTPGAAAGTAVATYANALDPSDADQAAGLRYSFDFNGDDDFADPGEVDKGTSPTATFAYAAAGTYNVAGRVYDKDGGYTTRRGTVTVAAPGASGPLAGTVIGTAGSFGNGGNTIAKAFDGSLATYVDLAVANGAWAGLDLGGAKTVAQIRFAPRAGYGQRMVGGAFQGSNVADFSSGVATLYTISTKPVEGSLTTVAVSGAAAYRYVRYLSPNGGYGNVAEVTFIGSAGTTTTPPPPTTGVLTGTAFGTAGSFSNGGNTIAKAFDGSLATYVDLAAANGNVIGLDLGGAKTIAQIRFAPRGGWTSRMTGGVFQGSNTADFSTGVTTLYTIATKPAEGALTTVNSLSSAAYRYVRYLAPAGSYGNVAEIQFVGSAGTTTPPTPPTTTPTALAGTAIGTAGSFGNGANTIAKVFDDSLSTYFDAAQASGAWAGLDLGVARAITSIQYAPRSGWSSRMIGGVFQASNSADFSSGVVALATVTAKPTEGVYTTVAVTTPGTYRYVRYLSPTNGYANVAEVKFFG